MRTEQWAGPDCLRLSKAAPSKASQELRGRVQVPQTQQNAYHIGRNARAAREQMKGGAAGRPNSHSWRPPYPRLHASGTSAPTTTASGAGVPVFGAADAGGF